MISRVGRECCGCAACANSCPKHCITMTANNEGFLYPKLQEENCVNCGACEKVCPILTERSLMADDLKHACAVIVKDQDIVMKSSSGGLFSALAETVIKERGCVFGAAFTEDFSRLCHVMVENTEALDVLRGSKYIQSDIGDSYSKVRKELDRDRWVFFTGTPCQIAGLKCFLTKDYDKLICADLICHGTPSVLMWQHYLKNTEKKLGEKACAVSFRDKTDGWKRYGMNISAGSGEKYHSSMQTDPYLQLYLKNYCLRESCYHCSVKNKGIFSDISMGDLWGADTILPETDSSRGVSLAIIHTEKGKHLFDRAAERMQTFDVDYEQALLYNPLLTESVNRPSERDRFYSDLHKRSWKKLEKHYLGEKRSAVIRRKISTSPIGAIKRKVIHCLRR